jgi:DNA uptake protein ComE-like DNA-binding protein
MKGTRVQSIIRELRGEKIDIVEYSDDPIAFVTNALSPAKVQRVSIVDDHERVMEVVVEDKQLSLAIGKKGQNVRLAAKLTGWRIDIKSEEEKRREVEAQFGELAGPADDSADLSAEAGVDGSAKADAGADGSAKAEAGQGESGLATTEAAAGTATEAGGVSAESVDTPVPYTLAGIGEKTVRKLVDGGFATLVVLRGATAEQLAAIPGIGDKTAEKILAAARGEAAPADAESSADL